MRSLGLPLFVVVLVLAPPLAGPAQADGSVSMKANRFEPRDLTIGARQKVTWTNNDSLGHTVTADDGSFDSHPKCGQVGGSCMNRGQSFSHTFANPGRYQYYCRNHGSRSGQGMSGTIEVK